ncbi:methionyl-tRNA formyltransferase, putative [Babesia caballi]|uniref:Methionyl-tRNA formyltransferase, putative n=1 Tax=Babesia caballi TaxID=5871 RepID=A0AAV4LXP0_BABCB|nr:methionyl-tRNA formyltransferase, putative [Babesia caballi]
MSRPEPSLASGSGFDEELGSFLSAANGSSFVELLRKKYAIGSTISVSFTGSDADAFTFAHSLSYRRPWHAQPEEAELKLRRVRDRLSADLYCIFHQQLCKDWQSRESALQRNLRIFEILPHRKTLIHLADPKTNCLVLLTLCFALDNVTFVGLHNAPRSGRLPGPYLGLLHPESRESFLEALCKLESLHKARKSQGFLDGVPEDDGLGCDGRLAEISYLASEFDDLLGYVLCDPGCYRKFTKPLMQRTYTNRLYGKLMVWLRMRDYRERHRAQTLASVLRRLNELLRIVCRILNDIQGNRGGRPNLDHRNFGTMAVMSLIYSYLYGLLSVPIRLTPWNKTKKGEACTCEAQRRRGVDLGAPLSEPGTPASAAAPSVSASAPRDYGDSADLPSHQAVGLLGVDFASVAADAACVESTRRRDVMMSHAIGLLSDDGNWLRRSERYVDVIDNYKLSLCWYRRPLFSNCLLTNFRLACPWALLSHQTIVGLCGSTWLEWQGKTIESWSSLPLWRTAPPSPDAKVSGGGECVRCLKRLVCLRLRDCASYIFDLEFEIKRAARRHYGT